MIKMVKISKLLYYWLPVLAYAGLIFYLSSLTQIPSGVTANFADWMLHMIEYSILALLLLRAFGKSASMNLKNWAAILAILIATAYGITDELHQSFISGRVMSGFDILADFFGSMVAVVAVAALSTKISLFDFFKTSASPEKF